jgi:hypothetical protein
MSFNALAAVANALARYKISFKLCMCGSEKSRFFIRPRRRLLGARVLGDRLRALAHGVLGQLSGQQQANGRLDLATRDRRTTVVVSETRRFGSDALEDVVHEAVHDRHGLAADARVGVNLLQHLVDVDGIALPSPPLSLLVPGAHGFRLARGLLRSLARWFRRHVCRTSLKFKAQMTRICDNRGDRKREPNRSASEPRDAAAGGGLSRAASRERRAREPRDAAASD